MIEAENLLIAFRVHTGLALPLGLREAEIHRQQLLGGAELLPRGLHSHAPGILPAEVLRRGTVGETLLPEKGGSSFSNVYQQEGR